MTETGRHHDDFARDRISGSGDVALGFLAGLVRWARVDTSGRPPALRAALLAHLRDAQRAQPTFALVHQLATRALEVVDTGVHRGDAVAALRAHLEASCAAEAEDLIAARAAVARTAVELLVARGSWLATLSSSGVVRDAVLAAHAAGREPRVLVGEGRPNLEGRAMAAALAARGVPTWLIADAALPLLLSPSAAVWIGADAVTDSGALNKIGSYAAALAAREHGVPVYVLAERRKFLPANTPALKIAEMDPAELWEAPPEGVRPRNVYFELVPMALVRGIVVEDGVLGPTEAAALARERPVAGELASAP